MNDDNNFLDKNSITAIILCFLVLVGWQTYMEKKYPQQTKPQVAKQNADANAAVKTTDQGKTSDTVESTPVGEALETEKMQAALEKTKTFAIDFETFSGELLSVGMGLKGLELKNFSDRDGKNIGFGHPLNQVGSFATLYKNQPLRFNVDKKSDTHFVGVAQAGDQTVIKEMTFDPKTYLVNVSIKTLSGTPKLGEVFETRLSSPVLKVKSSMFVPAYEGTEFFTINDGSEERERIDIESNFSESFDKSSLTSIGTQYFALALNDQSETIPKTKVAYDSKTQIATASVFHQAATKGLKTEIAFAGFMGPKKYDILKSLDTGFVQMINYGIFGFLSKPMLSLLKWMYGLFSNWGLAIVLLTVFIRLLLLPINISSLKSMKKMQKIQPQLKAIKEKYKDDPQRVNQETMALMKKEKANPLGGCLPMLLQLPVFLALYSVLGQSVELYKSPFIFWIQDLSYQDPYFVLPVAVGALYFVQMSITPQPADPTQAKMMKFIPILFCFFMITVPSGLTLYFFVNTVFGIGQTFIFQREKQKAAA